MPWKSFPYYWPRMRGVHRSKVASNAKVLQSFDVFFVVSLDKLVNKQSSFQWFEMPWRSCDVTLMTTEDSNILSAQI